MINRLNLRSTGQTAPTTITLPGPADPRSFVEDSECLLLRTLLHSALMEAPL